MTDVLIVGAGPTGLVLACDLARRGAAVRIVDRSPAPPRTSRAKGPNPRSLEILDDLEVAEEVFAAGSAPLPMLKYRDRLAGHGVRVGPGREVVGLAQARDEVDGGDRGDGGDEGHVDVTYADGSAGRARYVVGCDGAHSSVRKLLGIGFEGTTDEDQVMVCGDVDLAEGVLDRTRWHQWFDEDGAVMLCPIPGTRTGWWFQAGPERDGRGRPLAPTTDGFRRLLAHHTALPGQDLTRAELPGPHAGDRAPDAPCADAATGVRTRLHRVFAGPRTTVLGFGPGSAAVLREAAEVYGDAGVRVCRVYAAHEDRAGAEPGAVVDDAEHAAAAYGTGAFGGTGTGTVVVVRPDHHVGVSAPADDARSVREYLHRLHGTGRSAERSSGMVDAVR